MRRYVCKCEVACVTRTEHARLRVDRGGGKDGGRQAEELGLYPRGAEGGGKAPDGQISVLERHL